MNPILLFVIIFSMIPAGNVQEAADLLPQHTSIRLSNRPLDAIAHTPDGTMVAAGGRDNAIYLWNVDSGEPVRTLAGHTDWITRLAFSSDGAMLLSASRDDTALLWDVERGEIVRTLRHSDDVTGVDFASDDGWLVTAGRDGRVMVQGTHDAHTIAALTHAGGAVWDVAVSPRDDGLALAGDDGLIRLWDRDRAWYAELSGHAAPVMALAYAPDGTQLLSSSLDSVLHLWDVEAAAGALTPSQTFTGHLAPALGVGFSADGRTGFSNSLDGTLRLWDLAGVVERGLSLYAMDLGGHPATQLAAASTQLASVGTDGYLQIWDIAPEALDLVYAAAQPGDMAQRGRTTDDTGDHSPQAPPASVAGHAAAAPQAESAAPLPAAPGGRTLRIPSVSMSVGVTTFFLDGTTWAIDPWEQLVGHFQGTSWVSGTGNVVLGGHSEYPNGAAGIFKALYAVRIGDEIFLSDGGMQRRYVVSNVFSVDYQDLSVVYPTAHNRLTLVTCDVPSYDPNANGYAQRLVVVAEEAP